jgi:DNA polymerase elongation subunit (family B)
VFYLADLTLTRLQRLGKNPEDYPDVKSQPHVQVALRMKAKGGTAKMGDVIPYIFCTDEGEESTKTAQAEKAKHPDEVRKSNLQVGKSSRNITSVIVLIQSRPRVLPISASPSTN